MTNPLPISPRMSYGQMRHVLSTAEPDLHVRSAQLPGKLDGLYCLSTKHRAYRLADYLHAQTLRPGARARALAAWRRHHTRLHRRQERATLPTRDRHAAHQPGRIRIGGTHVRRRTTPDGRRAQCHHPNHPGLSTVAT